ncbi:thioesterase family protein [Zestomonas carbonaria]|uniref:L-carnitine dehydrogenase n=1 Tax=Zestomonas carbonaria TaxID=2762745 RepID=A0A7U7I7B8_9GAMM|nr:thioesterase family protein [Pseudomonas carbonaria]CAD5105941.1 L-carnitine dehydrogenase [Pseudomonas carbonaria]
MNLPTYQTTVHPDWVDYNGHLRDAFYLLPCSYATDALMDVLGLGEQGRAATGHTLYTLEAHLNYLAEAKLGQVLEVRTQLLAHDRKRLHILHGLYRRDDDTLLAASEQMLINIDTASGRSAPFHPDVEARIAELAAEQAGLEPLPYHGRTIGLPVR